MFSIVNRLAARRGFSPDHPDDETEAGRAPVPRSSPEGRRRTGLRGESFAYWYLRRHGYTIVARNYRLPHPHGEIDLIGWDGDVLAFVEVKTRTTSTAGPPEQAVHSAKQEAVERLARHYLARAARRPVLRSPKGTGGSPARRDEGGSREAAEEVPRYRFDILAIEAKPGSPPTVRLHKGAFGT